MNKIKLSARIHEVPAAGRQTSKKTAVYFLFFTKVVISPVGDFGGVILVSDRAPHIFGIISPQCKNREVVIGSIDFIVGSKLGLQFWIAYIKSKRINKLRRWVQFSVARSVNTASGYDVADKLVRSEEHTSELQSPM